MRLSRLPVVLAAGALLLVAGCGGSQKTATRPVPRNSLRGVIGREFARAGCSTAVAASRPLPTQTAFLALDGAPFGIAVTQDGRFALVDEATGSARGFRPRLVRTTPVPPPARGAAGNGAQVAVVSPPGLHPRLIRTIAVPQDAVGNSLTADGRYLLIADGGDGATVVDVQRAEAGEADAVLGTLTEPSASGGGAGAIEVTSSPDGGYAFVSLEGGGDLAVYNLRAALADRFGQSSYVGSVPLRIAPVGVAVSADGRWLYATSEVGGAGGQGTLSVVSLAKAEHDPAHAVLATVSAHCSPVRVAVSADGSTVWVTARESDQLLAFSAAKLRSDPRHALIAQVRVGEAPVGLALVNGGREVVVADSNRFAAPGAHAALTVVSTAAALAHRPALLGTIPAGAFPREMALDPDRNTLLVGNFVSDQLESVDVGSMR